MSRILIIGGGTCCHMLAASLIAAGYEVTTSAVDEGVPFDGLAITGITSLRDESLGIFQKGKKVAQWKSEVHRGRKHK
jgi:hypothetical protein